MAVACCLAAGCERDVGIDGDADGRVLANRPIPEHRPVAVPRHQVLTAATEACAQVCDCESCGVGHALSSVCDAMLAGDAEARRKALIALGDLREGADDDDDDATRRTIVVMTAGLVDPDEGVRDAAFETLLRLPDADRRALSLQVLGNDDADIKLALLKLAREPRDEFEFTFNFQALDAKEPEVREKASDNLKELIGKDFPSAEAAFDWWETAPEARELASTWTAADSGDEIFESQTQEGVATDN